MQKIIHHPLLIEKGRIYTSRHFGISEEIIYLGARRNKVAHLVIVSAPESQKKDIGGMVTNDPDSPIWSYGFEAKEHAWE